MSHFAFGNQVSGIGFLYNVRYPATARIAMLGWLCYSLRAAATVTAPRVLSFRFEIGFIESLEHD